MYALSGRKNAHWPRLGEEACAPWLRPPLSENASGGKSGPAIVERFERVPKRLFHLVCDAVRAMLLIEQEAKKSDCNTLENDGPAAVCGLWYHRTCPTLGHVDGRPRTLAATNTRRRRRCCFAPDRTVGQIAGIAAMVVSTVAQEPEQIHALAQVVLHHDESVALPQERDRVLSGRLVAIHGRALSIRVHRLRVPHGTTGRNCPGHLCGTFFCIRRVCIHPIVAANHIALAWSGHPVNILLPLTPSLRIIRISSSSFLPQHRFTIHLEEFFRRRAYTKISLPTRY